MILAQNNISVLYGNHCISYNILVEDNVVGTVALFFTDAKPFSDIFIKEEHRRKGYALQAKKKLIEKYKIEEVYSWVDKKNLASINLQYKMGCTVIEETDDKLLFVWKGNPND
jgi:RimJ/RimL family protein N-acetyltransferase